IVTRADGEMETCAVGDTGGKRDLQLMPKQFGAGSGAALTPLGPCLAATAAGATGTTHGNVERHRDTVACVTRRQLDGCPERCGPLLREKRRADAVHRRRDGGEIDDH